MKLIKFVDLKDQWKAEKSQLLPLIDKILSSGEFVVKSRSWRPVGKDSSRIP